jgi:hypothetical protein
VLSPPGQGLALGAEQRPRGGDHDAPARSEDHAEHEQEKAGGGGERRGNRPGRARDARHRGKHHDRAEHEGA